MSKKETGINPELTVRVSNGNSQQKYINSKDGYDLTPDKYGESYTVTGSTMDIGGVSNGASITYSYADANSVLVTLDSSWNSVKNVEVSSKKAGTVSLHNFVHTDVTLGGADDSYVTITDAKRGFVKTGKGDDTVDVEALTNNSGWSNAFDIKTNQGDDNVSITGDKHITYFNVHLGNGDDTIALKGGYIGAKIIGGGGYDVVTSNNQNLELHDDITFSSIEEIQVGAGNQIVGTDGDDTLKFNNVQKIMAGSSVAMIDAGDGNDSVQGSQNGDNIVGGTGNDTIGGLKGNDTLNGGEGDDLINAGKGDDYITGGAGADILNGHAGNDTFLISGTEGSGDRFQGGDGYDFIFSFGGDVTFGSGTKFHSIEQLQVSAGNKVLGTDGDDVLRFGGVGSILAGSETAIIDTLGGDDDVRGTKSDDIIHSGEGNDEVHGNDGNDTIDGGAGDDDIRGGKGDDVLTGGEGSDNVIGGKGDDIFIHNFAYGDDVDIYGGGQDTDTLRIIVQDDNHLDTDLMADLADIDAFFDGPLKNVVKFDDVGLVLKHIENLEISVLVNGTDGDDVLVGTQWDDVVNGGDGNDIYALNGNFVDYTITFTDGEYTITDVNGLYGTDTVTNVDAFQFADMTVSTGITVYDDAFSGDEDNSISGNVLADNGNGADVVLDGSALTVVAATFTTANGAIVVIAENGDFTYTPAENANGIESFTYTAQTADGDSADGQVTVIINAVNDAPLAADDNFSGDEDTDITGNLLSDNGNGADSDIDGDSLSVVAGTFTTNSGGTLVIAENGDFTYTPTENYSGEDGFTYTLTDGHLQDQGDVTFTVIKTNVAPVAADDVLVTDEDIELTGNLFADNGNGADTDADGDTITATPGTFATSAGGTVVIAENGDFTYTPAENYNGVDSFTYTISDGEYEDHADVNITVNAVNDAPVAADDHFSGFEDIEITGNVLNDNGNGVDEDIDGDILIVTAGTFATAQGGTIVLETDGSFTYTPAADYFGNDTFTYILNDGAGGSDQGVITFSLQGVDDSILGTEGDDNINGTIGQETIDALGGNDTVFASVANDTLYGGVGNDTISFEYAVSSVEASLNVNLANKDGFGAQDTIVGFENIIGSAQADVFYGNTDANVISAAGGDDDIRAREGDDTVHGGEGDDTIRGEDGNDILNGDDGNDNIFGGAGDDIINGGLGKDRLQGSTGNDVINGGKGNDRLEGMADDDELLGGDGEDVLLGGDGNDTLSGGEDKDELFGGIGQDVLNGDGGNDNLFGGDDDDVLSGGEGDDRLEGEGGNDTFDGGAGDDRFEGGIGIDTAIFTGTTSGVNVRLDKNIVQNDGFGGTDEIYNVENIVGTDLDDEIVGDGQDNTLDGGNGNDNIIGGDGNDTLSGGDGKDNIEGGLGNDVINGGAGKDRLEGGEGDDILNGGDDDDSFATSAGADVQNGDAGDDVLLYDDNDTFNGGSGVDKLRIDSGNGATINISENTSRFTGIDQIRLNNKGDVEVANLVMLSMDDIGDVSDANALYILGDAAFDSVQVTGLDVTSDFVQNIDVDGRNYDLYQVSGNSLYVQSDLTLTGVNEASGISIELNGNGIVFTGNDDATSFAGTDGDDIINAMDGDDTIFGSAGNDELYGGAGVDTLDLSAANAGVNVRLIKNDISNDGFGGQDIIDGVENVIGSNHNDVLKGDNAANVLNGGEGDDEIKGYDGDDTIIGGNGSDELYGNEGADTFGFLSVDGLEDRIEDFEAGIDHINITDILDGFDSDTDDINDFVQLESINGFKSSLNVDVDGGGDNYQALALIIGADFTGTTVDDLLADGTLITNQSLIV